MRNDTRERVRIIQASMSNGARQCFVESEIGHLDCLIRLTVEVAEYLQSANIESLRAEDVRYMIESIFSGIDSFCSVSRAYRSLLGAMDSDIEMSMVISLASLTQQFSDRYENFVREVRFEKQCRLLLDLFKLQIMFAGAFYD